MFMSVDLPEPEAPTTAKKEPGGDVEADAAQGVDGHVPERVGALEVDHPDEGLGHRPTAVAAGAAAG